MAQYGSHVPKTDEYGNQVHTTGAGATMGEYGGAYQNQPSATAVTHGTGVTGHAHDVQHHGTTGAGTGILQRSGSSSSSSSSEDDGMGGRRKKKGVMEKIKEKLPGGGHGKQEQMSTTTTAPYGGTEAPYGGTESTGTYGHQGEHHEKKGMMDKIKEKLPGHHQ